MNLAEDFIKKNNGQPFIMNANGKQIPDYIQQRKEDYTKTKEREREAAKAAVHANPTGSFVGRTPLKTKQFPSNTFSVISKRSNSTSTLRTPLTTSRRVGIPQLPTGKTPLLNSTMKLRTQKQLQTTKRINIDTTSSTIVTPVKQRRLINQVVDTMKNTNISENISSQTILTANTSTGFKTSMMTTPGKRPLIKRGIPIPIHTHKQK